MDHKLESPVKGLLRRTLVRLVINRAFIEADILNHIDTKLHREEKRYDEVVTRHSAIALYTVHYKSRLRGLCAESDDCDSNMFRQ